MPKRNALKTILYSCIKKEKPNRHKVVRFRFLLVGRGGFEPPKSKTSDLQSDPFGRSGICPYLRCSSFRCGAGDWTRTHNLLITNQLLCQLSYTGAWCLKVESNRRQRDFQSLALPTELSRHVCPQKFLSDKQIIYGDPNEARTRDLQRDRLAL